MRHGSRLNGCFIRAICAGFFNGILPSRESGPPDLLVVGQPRTPITILSNNIIAKYPTRLEAAANANEYAENFRL